MKHLHLLVLSLCVLLLGCTQEELYSLLSKHHTVVQHTEVEKFMPAGELGGPKNVLKPGTFSPPTEGGKATLRRGSDYIQFTMHTTGLPKGAYTVWYVIFNDPDACSGECGEDDLFLPKTAVVWATGKVVMSSGVGNFSDKLYVGERREPETQEGILGESLMSPLQNAHGAEVHLIVKYHGPASRDPHTRYEQLHTLLGSCGKDEGANSFDAGAVFGIQCFDPQVAVFLAPQQH